ncbi:hypothetical protein CPB83DRAFT_851128 [Crepidotus variabilis]|uniref:GRIP domain-containing protein n=1 Tax=Crepidotus variabilis TaxID=179855 RepID=A0A9P6EKA6_9AGAR|nr:hypothetical protein CPB83DRAFT_851128 [Crepidotus variabilis]
MTSAHKASGSLSESTDNKMARSSLDSQQSGSDNGIAPKQNGHASTNGVDMSDGSGDPVERLQRELERTREEKETLATQYRNLLAKLTQMRTTLGNKLQQDAEELDRREQLIQQLTAERDDFSATINTLKAELITSHEEAERVSSQLDSMRTRVLQDTADESLQRERELRDAQMELERCRMEREEWERSALREQTVSEELRTTVEEMRRDFELESVARANDMVLLEQEREKSENLQSVLQDFQAAKDHELKAAVQGFEKQLLDVTQSLAEYKHRALTAEMELEESRININKTQELEKEVKEKRMLIEKLRHETVIINEHLMEALRRLRRNSSENNVDRRLVTNVLLSFLTTPRGDTKRFEMLSLLSSILSWTDQDREKAGLQRTGPHELTSPSGFWGRSVSTGSPGKPEIEKTDETESFSRLWVEFLLTEANSGGEAGNSTSSLPSLPRSSTSTLPTSPTGGSYPNSPFRNTRRLSSLSNMGMASSPNLHAPSPSRKGKDKEAPS